MPPEQLPWDRRDFRKHERSTSDPRFLGGGGGFGGRWRDHHHPHAPPPPSPHPPPYHHHQNPQQPQRWYSDFRSSRPIPTSHGKQGGWHMYSDEADHGFPPFGSRHNDRSLDDDSLRPLGFRGDGRYLRNTRESRGVFGHKDWRSPNWEISAGSSGPGKPTVEVSNQNPLENASCNDIQTKSSDLAILVTDLPLDQNKSDLKEKHEDFKGTGWDSKSSRDTAPSSVLGKPTVELNNHNHVGSMSICDDNHEKCNDVAYDVTSLPSEQNQLILEEKHEDFESADCVTRSSHKFEKENILGSIDWKPLKWSRSGNLSSRCSSFSKSNSSRGSEVHHNEIGDDLQPEIMMPIESSAAGNSVALIAPSSSDSANPRKKPRIGWGEGLAKYEKKKVEVPDNVAGKDGLSSIPDKETLHSPSVNLLDMSPTASSLSMSPTIPCSVARIDENESIKAVAVDQINASIKSSLPQADNNEPIFDLERSDDLSCIAKMSNLINELLHSNASGSVETDYIKSTSLNKLLAWKANVLKALEVTESEIDSLETKSKSLVGDARSCSTQPSIPEMSIGYFFIKPCLQMDKSSSFDTETNMLKPSETSDLNVGDTFTGPEDKIMVPMYEEIQSPLSASPKLVESSPSDLSFKASECAKYLNVKPISSCVFDQLCHRKVDRIYDSIISSNKVFANKVSDELNMLPPSQCHNADISTSTHVFSLPRDSLEIKENILMRVRALKFKEKVLILKYNVFQHFWKEGRVVSLRKIRRKSHKKFDFSQTVCITNNSSSPSRHLYSAGSLLTVPADELIHSVNSLLSKFPLKPCRSTLKMPPLILDRQTKKSRFVSNNGLVDDPSATERERSMINPWTAGEREIFIDKLAIFGKDFRRIASFLDHKTIADCVEFYYKNHKSECFSRAKRKSDSAIKKSHPSTYLLGAGKRFYQDSNAVSLETQPKYRSQMFGSPLNQNSPRGDENASRLPNNFDFYSNETAAVDVLAGIRGSLSSEAMSSCITSSIDPADGNQDQKLPRNNLCIKRPLTPDVTQCVDECSEESCEDIDSVDWSDEEKSLFIQAVSSHGKDFLLISRFMGTRSRDECKVFFSKAHKCLGLDMIQPRAAYAVSDSDTEGACVNGTYSSDLHVKICKENTELMARNSDKSLDNKSTKERNIMNGCETDADFDAMGVSSEMQSKPVDDQCNDLFNACDQKTMFKVSDLSHSTEKLSEAWNLDEVLNDTESGDIMSCEATVSFMSDRMMTERSLALNESCPIDADSNVTGNTSCAIAFQHNLSESMDSTSKLFPVPIKYQRNSFSCSSHQRFVDAAHSQMKMQKLFRQPFSSQSNHSESNQILKGNLVSVTTCQEITRDSDNESGEATLECGSKKDKKLASHQTKDPLQECDHSRHQWFQSPGKNGGHPKYLSGVPSEEDKPSRNGDVKLFGKILVSSELKPSFVQNTRDVTSGTDTRFPPLPDSCMLKKCCGTETQSPLDKNAKSIPCLSNGAPGKIVVQNQGLQCLTKDAKQSKELLLAESEIGNGYDPESGMQFHSIGMIDGVLAAQCTGVPDPIGVINSSKC